MRKSDRLFESENHILEYSHLISNSIIALIDRFDGNVGIVLCFDYKTWRKQYYPSYKGTREYDDSINWDAYFKFVDDYCQNLIDKHEFKISRIEGAEADDLIYLWSKKLNNAGSDCIIVSEDKDLHQLVKSHDDGSFTIIYNNSFKNAKIYKDPGTNLDESFNKIDILNASDILSSSRSVIKKIINEVDSVEDINVQEFIITKLLTGDDGDNVPSVWTWLDKNNRNKRITPKVAEKIYNNFASLTENPLYLLYNDFDFFKNILAKSIEFVIGLNVPVAELEKNIERNATLMCLHYKFIPKNIIKDFQKSFDENTHPVYERITFLHGTRYFQDGRYKIGKGDRMDSYFGSFGD